MFYLVIKRNPVFHLLGIHISALCTLILPVGDPVKTGWRPVLVLSAKFGQRCLRGYSRNFSLKRGEKRNFSAQETQVGKN